MDIFISRYQTRSVLDFLRSSRSWILPWLCVTWGCQWISTTPAFLSLCSVAPAAGPGRFLTGCFGPNQQGQVFFPLPAYFNIFRVKRYVKKSQSYNYQGPVICYRHKTHFVKTINQTWVSKKANEFNVPACIYGKTHPELCRKPHNPQKPGRRRTLWPCKETQDIFLVCLMKFKLLLTPLNC